MFRASGFSVVEMIAVLAILSMIAAVGLPLLFSWTDGLRVEMAAGEMCGILHLARIHSIRHQVRVAVKFRTEPNGVVTYAIHRDGDGDGVRTSDIEAGTDPEIRPPRRLSHLGRRIRFGFPADHVPRDPGNRRRRLDRLDDPIRFNRSDLASFDKRGTATPGTIYVTDGKRHLAAVRVNNRSGKISVLTYDVTTEVWR